MKVWVETRTVEEPIGVVSGRFSSSVMFVAYERLLRRWVWVQGGGTCEKISEPQMIFVDEDWARKHMLAIPHAKIDKSSRIRRKHSNQLLFEL